MFTRIPLGISLWLGVLLTSLTASPAQANTIRVPADYLTIQAGIDAATSSGDTVLVADGTYTGAGNINVSFKGKAITVRSESNNPALCTIDCQGSGNGFNFVNRETKDSVLSGFTIQNGSNDAGGAVLCFSSPTITNCAFLNNRAIGGGIATSGGSPTITDCTFTNNTGHYGAGIYNIGGPATITNCTFTSNNADVGGGGICNAGSSPTITNCTFTNNSAHYKGGGLGASGGGILNFANANATVSNCTFISNTATGIGSSGGGMMNDHSSHPQVTYCTFTQNSASSGGGAMYNASDCHPMITHCTFTQNSTSSGGGGGGIKNDGASPTVTSCTFTSNSASDYLGGGMANFSGGSPTVTDCTFSNNTALGGGGMFNSGGNTTVTNCLFTHNTADVDGGGMYNEDASRPTVTNCTFTNNVAGLSGGGMANEDNSIPTVTNCILWGDVGSAGAEMIGDPVVTYSDVQGGWPGTGNINAEPGFVNPATGDYRLQISSFALDAGNDAVVSASLFPADASGALLDLDGNPRISGVHVDMGAYELPRDTTPPVITTPTSPVIAFATSPSGAVVNFNVTATDNVDETVPVTCSPASGSLFAPGKTTVNCTATDAAGNTASASFVVWVQYQWSGILQPVNTDGSSIFKAGSTIPIKFALTGTSASFTNLQATLTFARISNGDPGSVNEADSTSAATTGNLFRYTGGQYLFNWSTKGLTSGKYRLTIDLGDGVQRTVELGLK